MRSKITRFMIFLFCFGILFSCSKPSMAASLKKPKLDILSSYMYDSAYLKWSRVKGAKKYEIQRAKINPKKDNSVGKWKRWTTTKKTSIKKKTKDDYKYRVRAINGSKKSGWSTPKRLFAASAKITNQIYEKPEYIWGFYHKIKRIPHPLNEMQGGDEFCYKEKYRYII